MKFYRILFLVFFVIMSKANAQNVYFSKENYLLPSNIEINDLHNKKLKLNILTQNRNTLTQFNIYDLC